MTTPSSSTLHRSIIAEGEILLRIKHPRKTEQTGFECETPTVGTMTLLAEPYPLLTDPQMSIRRPNIGSSITSLCPLFSTHSRTVPKTEECYASRLRPQIHSGRVCCGCDLLGPMQNIADTFNYQLISAIHSSHGGPFPCSAIASATRKLVRSSRTPSCI